MFKLDFYSRVIGNSILLDGTKKDGIGDFIRKYSIDEFPQFWNGLKGIFYIMSVTKKNLEFARVSVA